MELLPIQILRNLEQLGWRKIAEEETSIKLINTPRTREHIEAQLKTKARSSLLGEITISRLTQDSPNYLLEANVSAPNHDPLRSGSMRINSWDDPQSRAYFNLLVYSSLPACLFGSTSNTEILALCRQYQLQNIVK